MATDTRDKSLVTSDGTESKIALTNPDGTQSNAVNAALNANKKRERIQFNPAFESRIEGFNERRTERAEARKQIVDFKRKEKLETQGKRLDKKVLRRTGEERTNKMSARQAADEVKFGNIAQNLDIKKGEMPAYIDTKLKPMDNDMDLTISEEKKPSSSYKLVDTKDKPFSGNTMRTNKALYSDDIDDVNSIRNYFGNTDPNNTNFNRAIGEEAKKRELSLDKDVFKLLYPPFGPKKPGE